MAKTEVPAETLPVRSATLLVATMPVPASPSGGQSGMPACSSPAGVEQLCAFFGQNAGGIPGEQDFGQDVLEFPREVFRCDAFVEQPDHAFIIIVGLAVDREHARGFAHAQHLLPGQLPVDIARQRGQMVDVC